VVEEEKKEEDSFAPFAEEVEDDSNEENASMTGERNEMND